MVNKYIALIFALLFSFQLFANENYKLDDQESEIKWTGKKVTGEHWGYVPFDRGFLTVRNGRIINGEFSVDMNLLNVQDLTDEETNEKLTGHLKSDDFFSVAKYPKAFFRINKALVNAFAGDGEPNYTFSGELTIKGITKPITFPAIVTVNDEKITATANFTFNRAKYEVKFRSGSFFDNLGDKMIYDDVPLNIKITAYKADEEIIDDDANKSVISQDSMKTTPKSDLDINPEIDRENLHLDENAKRLEEEKRRMEMERKKELEMKKKNENENK